MENKTLNNTTENKAQEQVSDLEIWGEADMWSLLSKASSEKEGWMKSTKAMQVDQGCLVQVTTQQRNPDGSYSIAEALNFVPSVRIVERRNEAGEVDARRLVNTELSELVERYTISQYAALFNEQGNNSEQSQESVEQ